MNYWHGRPAKLILGTFIIFFLSVAVYSPIALAQTPTKADPTAEAIGILASDLDEEQQSALIGLLRALKVDTAAATAGETRAQRVAGRSGVVRDLWEASLVSC